MSNFIRAFALVTLASLAACATQDTSGWPKPETIGLWISGIDATYHGDCLIQKGESWCSSSAQKAERVCKATADAGLATYTEAYTTGNVTQAVLDNESALAPSLIICINKIKGKG